MTQPVSTLPPEADQVLISVNPKAGRRSASGRVDQLVDLLQKRGYRTTVSTDLGEVCDQANRRHEAGQLRALVGVGGDGTAAELVNRAEPGVPVTLLPAGTANLLSKCFHLSNKPARVCETIAAGRLLRLDAGRASGRLFLVMVSCGFDAEVVRRVHAHRQQKAGHGHISYLTYLKPIVRAIRSYQYPEIRIDWDGASDREEADPPAVTARWAFVFNLPRYGWGLPLAPEAVGTDGLLDLCTFRGGSLSSGLRYLIAAQLGSRHRHMADCVMARAKRFRISSPEPVAYQLDGDPSGELPVDVEVIPNRLTLVVPPQEKEAG